jgi:uncharacterized protein YbjT (DUF2867 family)
MTTVLVTGARGNVGRHVVRGLRERGLDVVAASSEVTTGAPPRGDEVARVRLDFLDRRTWPDAVRGATRMFLMRPPAISDVQNNVNPFVDFAREQGVEHVVFLSVAGAGTNRFVPHRKVEDHLRLRGEHHTNLRPGFFAQNLESASRQDIVEDDRIYVPAGRIQPVNWIDARDIAEVAALVLADPAPHRARNYTLAGPGAVPWSEVADALTAALGRTIVYTPASVPGYVCHLSPPAAFELLDGALSVFGEFRERGSGGSTFVRVPLAGPDSGVEEWGVTPRVWLPFVRVLDGGPSDIRIYEPVRREAMLRDASNQLELVFAVDDDLVRGHIGTIAARALMFERQYGWPFTKCTIVCKKSDPAVQEACENTGGTRGIPPVKVVALEG